MGPVDVVIAAVVLAAALALLYRSLRRGGAKCHGCPGGGCGSRAEARPASLVKLGGGLAADRGGLGRGRGRPMRDGARRRDRL